MEHPSRSSNTLGSGSPAASSAPNPLATSWIQDLTDGFRRQTESLVPWFLEAMPAAYFRDTDPAAQRAHLRALIAARASGQPLRLTLRSDDGLTYTFLGAVDRPGTLAAMVRDLPVDLPLRVARVHTSADGSFVVDTFELGEHPRFDPADAEQRRHADTMIAWADANGGDVDGAAMRAHLERSTAGYVRTVTAFRAAAGLRLFRRVTGTDNAVAALEQEEDSEASRILLAVGNATPRRLFERVAACLGEHAVDIRRAYLDVFDDPGNGFVSLLSFVVRSQGAGRIDEASGFWRDLSAVLVRLKWLDEETLAFARRHAGLGIARAEVLTGLAGAAHAVLARVSPLAFTRDRLLALLSRSVGVAGEIASFFLASHDPKQPLSGEALKAEMARLRGAIEQQVDSEDGRRALGTVLDAAVATVRTNVFVPARYALALRMDPVFFSIPEGGERPHAVFFVHGRDMDGFHVRMRDIARGGARVVRPVGPEQHALESERLFLEAYGLASAQQLKNKDIPEGGAKAVLLTKPGAPVSACVKAFSDALLDLLTPDPETRAHIAFAPETPEILYLGPDENITTDHIRWIVARAARRGYPLPLAFMSSKPGAGINHKEYGVTSEGVTVFLHAALRAAGIDPYKQPFSVKLTGGPDGDVAGNEIKILFREHGDRVKIVGIADGSGSGEDPDGFDREELLRLVRESLPIGAFDRSKLGPRGRVVRVDEPDGPKLRATMHLRVVADAFVPAGGRPATLSGASWRAFLLPNGAPSSRVIVEGANLFLTPEAREGLTSAGALIVKDSSANKCGVICSSFEIAAAMLLDEQTILANKERLVEEVIGKLRHIAGQEATLLFREHQRRPDVSLPALSVRISEVVRRTGDAIESALARGAGAAESATAAQHEEIVEPLVAAHLPSVLMELAPDAANKLPPAYVRRMVSAALACRIVYKEGLDWAMGAAPEALGALAIDYFRAEREALRLASSVRAFGGPLAEAAADLIERAGARALAESPRGAPTAA